MLSVTYSCTIHIPVSFHESTVSLVQERMDNVQYDGRYNLPQLASDESSPPHLNEKNDRTRTCMHILAENQASVSTYVAMAVY